MLPYWWITNKERSNFHATLVLILLSDWCCSRVSSIEREREQFIALWTLCGVLLLGDHCLLNLTTYYSTTVPPGSQTWGLYRTMHKVCTGSVCCFRFPVSSFGSVNVIILNNSRQCRIMYNVYNVFNTSLHHIITRSIFYHLSLPHHPIAAASPLRLSTMIGCPDWTPPTRLRLSWLFLYWLTLTPYMPTLLKVPDTGMV